MLACDEPQLLPAAIKAACTQDAHAACTLVQPDSKPSYEQTLESLSELGIAPSSDLQVLESRLRSHISSLESELNLVRCSLASFSWENEGERLIEWLRDSDLWPLHTRSCLYLMIFKLVNQMQNVQ